MLVCKDCFVDKELKAFISSSLLIGDCDVCGSTKTNIIDLKELLDFFSELLQNFVPSPTGIELKNKISGDWSFFKDLGVANTILNMVLSELSTPFHSSSDLVEYQADIIECIDYWQILKKELKTSRRYIPDIDRLEDLGWDGFFSTQYQLESKDRLFRARLHHESGKAPYSPAEMMSPPATLATAGRANPSGIPYLYLSDNQDTVLYEIRAAYLDELSIGEFKLKNHIGSIKIVDFTEDTALFQLGKVNQTIKGKLLRSIISRDLSKPMRRYDSELEYIPTQFICEYIKIVTGAKGVRFASSLYPTGNNLVIFDQTLMECLNVVCKKINKLTLHSAII